MICEMMQSQLTALADGELALETADDAALHLAACPGCAHAHAEMTAVREMASAWTVDAPDISVRVQSAIAAADQNLLLDEVRLLRSEMEALRAEVSGLRRQLERRAETPPQTPSARFDTRKDYPRMENDPWNLARS